MSSDPFSRFFSRFLMGSLLVGGLIVFADYQAVAPNGSTVLKTLVTFFVLPLLLSIPIIPIAVFCCISRRLRRPALRALAACATFAIVFVASICFGERVRMGGFHALAQRSRPLIEAIQAYEREHGRPPPTLNDLVPNYLPSIPETGMASYPQYRYCVGNEDSYEGNPWVLEVFTSSGILNFDTFFYYPKQNYDSRHGDALERVGDWAYFHE